MGTNDPPSGTGDERTRRTQSAPDADQGFNPAEIATDKQPNFPNKGDVAPLDIPTGHPPADPRSSASGAQPHMNPGDISSFDPQPDIPGMGNPGATQSTGSPLPPNPGNISGFNPQPDIPGMGNPSATPSPGASEVKPGAMSSFNPQPDIPGMGNPGGTQRTVAPIPPNPGDISGFNPQPDIPGMGNPATNPGDISSFNPQLDIPGIGSPARSAGDISSFDPRPDIPGMGNPGSKSGGKSGGKPGGKRSSTPRKPNKGDPAAPGAPTGGTPTWTAPGPPDSPFRKMRIVGLILLLLLLGAGGFLAIRAGVFGGCQSGYHGGAVAANMLTSCNSGNTSGGQTGPGAIPTVDAPTATTLPTATVAPTATAKPTPPTPTVRITAPTNTKYDIPSGAPTSPPITFRASTTAGSGASSVTVTWFDNVGNTRTTLGTGTSLTRSLSSLHRGTCKITTHVITANVKNNLGRTASASITVYVQPHC